jgi:hypothetical protein
MASDLVKPPSRCNTPPWPNAGQLEKLLQDSGEALLDPAGAIAEGYALLTHLHFFADPFHICVCMGILDRLYRDFHSGLTRVKPCAARRACAACSYAGLLIM